MQYYYLLTKMETLRHMNEYRKSNKFCDISIVVGETNYKAHKAVLAACSAYFAEALDNDLKELKVDSVTSDEMEIALNFVYTGKIEITKQNVENLLKLAEALKLTKLKDRSEKFKQIEEELEIAEVDVPEAEIPESKDPDFVVDNAINEIAGQNEDDAPLAVEIIRSKPVSIFPISKRSERKAKQDAYKAFKMIEGYDDTFERITRSRRRSDEDYRFGNTSSSTTSTPATVPKKRRASRYKYTCPTCYKKFDQVMVYNIHLLCHDEEEEEEQVELVDSEKLLETMGKGELHRNGLKPAVMPRHPHLTCDVCGKMFATTHNLKVHLKTHTKDLPFTLGGSNEKKKQIPCTVCGKVFKTTSHVKRHMITHTGERKHCCTTCGKLFLKNDHLKRHERTHTSERPFACEQCGKTFRDKDHLKRHHLTHSDVRPYFCEICGKQFKERNTLQSHQKVHSAAILACHLCNRTFKGEATLKKHLLRHEQGNAHVCEVCGKNFETSGRLRKHMLTHTGDRPHHCDTCGKQFRDPHSLRLHQKRHTGIGLHPCKECGKDFTNPFHLKRHMRVHSGEKPFRCDVCKKTFSRSDNLEAHKRICSGKQVVVPKPPSSASSLPTLVHTVTFIDGNLNSNQPTQKEPAVEKEINTSTPSLNNILSQMGWHESVNLRHETAATTNGLASGHKTPENVVKEPLVNTWNDARPNSGRVQEEPVNLGKNLNIGHPPTTNVMMTSSVNHPSSSPPLTALHHSKRVLPNSLGGTVPSAQGGAFQMDPDFVRSRYYALQSQAYPGQPSNSTTTQQYQQVQMPTPLHSNQATAAQHPAQQLLNFDVNAAVNSFIGYGAL